MSNSLKATAKLAVGHRRRRTCGQPKGICLPGCPNPLPAEVNSFYPVELGEEVGDRDDYDLAT
jgi:hypothetical protein